MEDNLTWVLQIVFNVLGWFLLSLSTSLLLRKLSGKHRWMAWIDGLRYYALGNALGIRNEGIVCALLDLSYNVLDLWSTMTKNETLGMILRLLLIVALITLIVYRIRIFMQLIRVFSLKKRWILLWLVCDWLALLLLAVNRRLQPDPERIRSRAKEDGTALSDAADLSAARPTEIPQSGLSIDVRDRSVRDFGRKKCLLKDIAMEIPNRSLVLLLGGSGAGKTTFVNAVIGYEQANASIYLNGCDVYREYDRVKYRIGFVPQQNLMRGNDTVVRTIDDAAQLRLPTAVKPSERSAKVAEVMELLGISAGSDGLISKKSGGQLRRISIAMELVTDPELFVLDEPDSGLDGVIAREIFQKLRDIADDGKIVMVITHTPDRVIDLFDRVIVLAKDSDRIGRLAFYGSPQEARAFFGRNTMEEIVQAVNSTAEGGEGLADQFIAQYALMTRQEGGADNGIDRHVEA
ncbi:MAG: ABC transporter ATP-binding protein [Clostridia bacterium]|nr:ABC transporter ATP-binding protein [Clostridia bacterium]